MTLYQQHPMAIALLIPAPLDRCDQPLHLMTRQMFADSWCEAIANHFVESSPNLIRLKPYPIVPILRLYRQNSAFC
jgi:hypothetical protein